VSRRDGENSNVHDGTAAKPLERVRGWLNDVQLSARLGTPHYENPGQLKHDVSRLLNVADAALAYQDELFLEETTGGGDPHHYLEKLGKALDEVL
jgi:hypothetical protein